MFYKYFFFTTIQVEVSSPGEREPESILCTSGQASTPMENETPETPQNKLVTDQLTHDINNSSTNESGMDLSFSKE